MSHVRKAVPGDLGQLVAMARDFTGESALPLTFNREKSAHYLLWLIGQPAYDVLVEQDGDVISGAAIVGYEAHWYDETCAYVEKMFVHKEFRGLGTARALVREIVLACQARGAVIVFAASTAGMGERTEKLYVRLFERAGFTFLGRVMQRIL